jgi:hypothetical protein
MISTAETAYEALDHHMGAGRDMQTPHCARRHQGKARSIMLQLAACWPARTMPVLPPCPCCRLTMVLIYKFEGQKDSPRPFQTERKKTRVWPQERAMVPASGSPPRTLDADSKRTTRLSPHNLRTSSPATPHGGWQRHLHNYAPPLLPSIYRRPSVRCLLHRGFCSSR